MIRTYDQWINSPGPGITLNGRDLTRTPFSHARNLMVVRANSQIVPWIQVICGKIAENRKVIIRKIALVRR